MKTELSDILKMYIDCPIEIRFEDRDGRMNDVKYGKLSYDWRENDFFYLVNSDEDYDNDEYETIDFEFKPILRRLDSMTDGEKHECYGINAPSPSHERNALQTLYLVRRHFDVFGLIEKGKAIDQPQTKY